MNILYLCDEYPPCQHGGIGTVTQNLARSLANKGHNIFVFGFYPYYRKAKKFEIDNGVNVYRFFYGPEVTLQFSKRRLLGNVLNIKNQFDNYLLRIEEIIQEKKIDLIESPDFVEAFRYSGPKMIYFPKFVVPFIVKLHGCYSIVNDFSDGSFGNKNIIQKEQALLDISNGILAVSKSVKQRAIAQFKINNDVHVIPNGIRIHYTKRDKNVEKYEVIFAGTLSENKGINNLIKAWDKVVTKIPNARLKIYGKGTKSIKQVLLKYLSSEIKKTVDFVGFVERKTLIEEYSNAACAVFPSYAETFGMAPLEAMMASCPTIFTKTTSGPEIIEHMQNGILVDPNNTQEIADAILYILLNPNEAEKLGKSGMEKINNNFDIDIISEKHLEYYSQILR